MYDELIKLVKRAGVLESVSEALEWDELVMMPGGAVHMRAEQMGVIASLIHQLSTDPRIGELLEDVDLDSLDENQLAQIKEIKLNYESATRIPNELIKKSAELGVTSNQVWEKARAENSFSEFAPYLEKFIDIRKEIAHHVSPTRDVYEVMCEEFESGVSVREMETFFSRIKSAVVPLVQEIGRRPAPDTSVLRAPVSERKQMGFNKKIAQQLGYNFKKGRLDTAVHPFCMGYGRITTRFDHGWWDSLTSTVHELGHAKYEHNLPFEHFGTPLGSDRSMGVHESQSLLWECYIGKSWQFWYGRYPMLKKAYAPILDAVNLDEFYRLINAVNPGFIRVEADEMTYPLHIILRFEIEKELIAGTLAVKDLPEAWNAKMQELLGITPPNDTLGCLQDVHWGSGLFGYFPTYSLGNIIAAQLWKAVQRDIPDLYIQLVNGTYSRLDAWLMEHIHRHGCRYETKELVRRATGEELAADDYVSYLQGKFSHIYNL